MMRALAAEFFKLKRSRMPLWTALVVLACSGILGLAILPVLFDPKMHAKLIAGGGVFAKAVALGFYDATWPNCLRVGLQGMTGSWGIMTFGLVTAYLFGREFKEGTANTLLTLPVRREYVVLAKMVVLAVWLLGLGALSILLMMGVGAVLGTPGFAWTYVFKNAGDTLAAVSLLYATLPFVAWFAMSGRGYLRPMLFSLVLWFSCNGLVTTPVSRWIPWTMPIHLVGASWSPVAPSSLVPSSYAVAVGVFLAGLAACMWRVDHADGMG
jgi:ABC-2 type transport system permease protein